MPIEIRELVIKATIADKNDRPPATTDKIQVADEQKIIQACVEQVLEILNRQKQR